ncbi:PEGA domain-containing protein [Candidatus Dojkabacteria bacterium]|nr:PEGA domain-containing protein [Candidatus Dojkabacteria bacterium]
MDLEKELKNLNCLKSDVEFKQNLRKRILNEYSFVHEKKNENGMKLSILKIFQNRVNHLLLRVVKFNSALSLSFIILLFVSIGSYASFNILPESVKLTVSEGFKSIGKPNVDFEVVSNIEGASVFVNDKYMGLTPLNIDIKEGAYSIRVEKDGYIAYNSEVTLDPQKLSNKLNIELPKSVTADNWIKYENVENNISFFYPDTWNLIEKKLENQNRISQIIVESGNTSLEITLKSSEDPTLLNTQKQKIYIGKISVNDKIYKRYLVFNQFNEYTLGGIWVNDNKLGRANITYNFDDIPQDQLLKSEQLNLLDQISMSFLSSQSKEYIYNPASFLAIENVEYIADSNKIDNNTEQTGEEKADDIVDIPDYLDITDDNDTKELISEYINKVYGYKIVLPENWFVSSSRAEYPLQDRGHLIEKDGKSYKVARLKIYSNLDGIIYIFMTNNDNYDINDGGDLCGIPEADRKVISVNDEFQLVTSNNTTKYNYQLCNTQDNASEIAVDTSKNGNIRYTVYWDAPDTEVLDTMDSFKEIINKIEFNDNYVETPIDKVAYTFKDDEVQFNYKYSWNVIKQDVECVSEASIPTSTVTISPTETVSIEPTVSTPNPVVFSETKCNSIIIKDGEQILVKMVFDKNGEELVLKDNQSFKTKELKGNRYLEVFSVGKDCKLDSAGLEQCEDKDVFNYGLGKINDDDIVINIMYYKSSDSVYNLLKSFRVL